MEPVIIVHGGAGNIGDDGVPGKLNGVRKAIERGYQVLKEGGTAIDCAQAAVEIMEDDEAFNAGRGSVLNIEGEVEMDAIVMEGTSLKVGSVGAVKHIAHPIALARIVMERSRHVFLVGDGANSFARKQNVPVIPAYRLVTQKNIDALEHFLHQETKNTAITEIDVGVGTVGAVVLDANGKIAVGTSTGGTLGKLPGRVGDTPLPGCGAYADDSIGGVSTTGCGESIMRVCLAHRIVNLMKQGKSARQATEEALLYLDSVVEGTAGAITVSKSGEVGIYFTSKRMAWAYKKGNEAIQVGIDHPN